ncbi:hypothetical protein ACJJTC_019135, partial [Scirpophaga incertulas]
MIAMKKFKMKVEKINDLSSSTISFIGSSEDGSVTRARKSFFTKNGFLSVESTISSDADTISECQCDLTPGSIDVWVDLPDEIKFDPSLEPFKRLYEQQHGKLETPEVTITDEDKTILEKKIRGSKAGEEDYNSETPIRGCESRLTEEVLPSEEKLKSNKAKKLKLILRVLKLSGLVACWVLLTASLIMNQERSEVIMHTAVAGGEMKEYDLKATLSRFVISVSLTGPFSQAINNDSSNVLQLWLHRESEVMGVHQHSKRWFVNLQVENGLDFSPSVSETKILILDELLKPKNFSEINMTSLDGFDWSDNSSNGTRVTLRMFTESNYTVPLTISYQMNPMEERDGIIYSTMLLCTLYFLIIFEVVNRTIAALLSSSLAIAVLAVSGSRPTLAELMSWLDVETLLLLFSMMILVAILAETGLFDYLAVVAFEVTGGHTWPLINCLCFFTAFFSTFLDNVTTVLLMTPVTI